MSIAVVGEAWGKTEAVQRMPFVGSSGYELTRMLDQAGIRRADCLLTNVFNQHPPGDDLDYFCGREADGIDGYPALTRGGKFVSKAYAGELLRLADELIQANPNIIIACGNTAMWALLGKTAITKYRGTTAISTLTVAGFKVLPTYHPAAVVRKWELRPTVVMDFVKARREAAFPEIRRPEVTIYVPETITDLTELASTYLAHASRLAVDIETAGEAITCIGFAPSPTTAIVVPFVDPRRVGRSYWPDLHSESVAWKIVQAILVSPGIRKTFQNGLYDIAFLWRANRIAVRGADEDTMLLHHSLQPEALKGLGYLGSVYAGDHGAWKEARARSLTIKRDE